MFGLFGNSNDGECPVNDDIRQWLEESMNWLFESFGEENIRTKKILTPEYSDLPVNFDGSFEAVDQAMKIVARQMEINPALVHLDFYIEGQDQIRGAGLGGSAFMQPVEGEKYSGGKYWGKQEDGKYHVWLEYRKLNEPLNMVATLAHEFAHIKLLGENRIEENDEHITDLTTIVFGMGIFNANASFQTFQGSGYSGYSKLGYLTQMEWGYSLAFYSYLRGEENPAWIQHLSTNVKSDFKKSMNFIINNIQSGEEE